MSPRTSKPRKNAKPQPSPPAPTPRVPGGDPAKLEVLTAHVDDIADIFGVPADSLVGRVPGTTPVEVATLAVRKLALGAVARLGRDLGLPWSGFESVACLEGAHRTSLVLFHAQFSAWTGLDVDGLGTVGEPTGGIARFARDRYRQVLRSALAEARRATC